MLALATVQYLLHHDALDEPITVLLNPGFKTNLLRRDAQTTLSKEKKYKFIIEIGQVC